ncbi:MAG: LD-carboxypeptidase [Gemmatimonadetes bacterium]|nr:LD-carboxypeptidase [Gemmatimonadota bacterium]MYG85503.1 LD-carboxypeptidase [Gemmatimonadota bacterium]MYJ91148.1 LD-carboxypeptidase [Gemmatimonadota bacterium]
MELTKPNALSEGSRIGLVSPARAIPLPHMEESITAAQNLGYELVVGKYAREKVGYFAGTHEQRSADLMAMFQDVTIEAIWCIHSGIGAERLFPWLDFGIIRQHPKLLVGHSNICQLHFMLHKHAFPWSICFQSLSVFRQQKPEEMKRAMRCFNKIVRGHGRPWDFPLEDLNPPVESLVSGRIRAPITGGGEINLTLGTPWEVDFEGKIVVLDLSHRNMLWSGFLTQLNYANKLREAAGFIIVAQTHLGEVPEWGNVMETGLVNDKQTLRSYLDEFITPLNKPTLMNVPMEHSKGAFPIPYGAEVELNADEKRITVLEDIVQRSS